MRPEQRVLHVVGAGVQRAMGAERVGFGIASGDREAIVSIIMPHTMDHVKRPIATQRRSLLSCSIGGLPASWCGSR